MAGSDSKPSKDSERERATTKGERTRERLYTIAIDRFEKDGYEAASMRKIAAEAGVTPALLYRYFANKEAIVAELYERSLADWRPRAEKMPKGAWLVRVLWVTQVAFDVLGPHRELLRVLSASMLEGNPGTSPLHVASSVEASERIFDLAVTDAKDAPRSKDRKSIRDLAQLTHLGLILFWTLDQSEGQRATKKLIAQAKALAPLMALGLKMPIVGAKLRALGKTIFEGLGR